MSHETTTTTVEESKEPSNDPGIAAVNDAYQDGVIDDETHEDLIEHRLSVGLESHSPNLVGPAAKALGYLFFGASSLAAIVAMVIAPAMYAGGVVSGPYAVGIIMLSVIFGAMGYMASLVAFAWTEMAYCS